MPYHIENGASRMKHRTIKDLKELDLNYLNLMQQKNLSVLERLFHFGVFLLRMKINTNVLGAL